MATAVVVVLSLMLAASLTDQGSCSISSSNNQWHWTQQVVPLPVRQPAATDDGHDNNTSATTSSDSPPVLPCGSYVLLGTASQTKAPGSSWALVQTPGYGQHNYPGSYRCTWMFMGVTGCVPAVRCLPSFRLQDSVGCRKDHLIISDGRQLHQVFCGSEGPRGEYIMWTTNILEMSFKSDGTFNQPGFQCSVTCLVPSDANDDVTPASDQRQPLVSLRGQPLPPPITTNACKCGVRDDSASDESASGHQSRRAAQGRVVGGHVAKPGEFPWLAGIVFNPPIRPERWNTTTTTEDDNKRREDDDDEDDWSTPFCGATIINDRYALTAAHCVERHNLSWLELVANVVDARDLSASTRRRSGASSSPVRRKIVQAVLHPLLFPLSLHHDVALLRLHPPLPLGMPRAVNPACLPHTDSRGVPPVTHDHENLELLAAGWGALQEDGESSPILRKVTLELMNQKKCADYYNFKEYPYSSVTYAMLCAGYPHGGKDTCQGDSGGPLTYRDDRGRHTLLGVVSWGDGCARPRKPGVFARVTEIMGWIRKHTLDAVWCQQ